MDNCGCGPELAEALSIPYFTATVTFVSMVLALRYFRYQSDVYTKMVGLYYPIRSLAVLGEGCRGVLD